MTKDIVTTIDHNQKLLPSNVKEVIQTIIRKFRPEKIILYGSYVNRQETKDSDLDLLVIMDSSLPPVERQRMISRCLYPRKIPLDIIVKTPDEIMTLEKQVAPFLRTVLSEGTVVYARS